MMIIVRAHEVTRQHIESNYKTHKHFVWHGGAFYEVRQWNPGDTDIVIDILTDPPGICTVIIIERHTQLVKVPIEDESDG